MDKETEKEDSGKIILPVIPGRNKMRKRKNVVIAKILEVVDGSEEKWVQMPTINIRQAIGSEGNSTSVLASFKNILEGYLEDIDQIGAYSAGWVEDSHKEFIYIEQRRDFADVRVVIGTEEGSIDDYKNIKEKLE